MRSVLERSILALAATALLAAVPACAAKSGGHVVRHWSANTLSLASSLPVQEGGRVKPLSTYAHFTLLAINGRSSVKIAPHVSRSSMEWLLDCLFYPAAAARYPVILVQDSAALDAVGLSHEGKKKRDRYSFQDIAPAWNKLHHLYDEYHRIDPDARTALQQQVLRLWYNMSELNALFGYLDFARHDYLREANAAFLANTLPKGSDGGLSAILSSWHVLKHLGDIASGKAHIPGMTPEQRKAVGQTLTVLQDEIAKGAGHSVALAFFPPSGTKTGNVTWMDPSDVTEQALTDEQPVALQVSLLGKLEDMVRDKDDAKAFQRDMGGFHAGLVSLARQHHEYAKVALEVFFYKGDFFFWSLVLFVIGFVLTAVSWLAPANRWIYRSESTVVVGGLALLVIGIVLRCIIRSRPPVSNLYETILFITSVAVLAAMVTEFINRRRIAVALAAALGAGGMFLAMRYELSSGDTMEPLQAVLRNNFWLATHVTTVTMGYAAGLLAAAIGHVYIFGKLFGVRKREPEVYKNLTRMTYGVLCFGLLFSVLGTFLGGIWANQSWGRFWGWDPKENGALMIVLAELAILHARLGGYIKDLGLAIGTVFNGCIVAFSWWGVNLLGVGLHSYGFDRGQAIGLYTFYGIDSLVLLAGVYLWMRNRDAAKSMAQVFD